MGLSIQKIVERVQQHFPNTGEAEIIHEMDMVLKDWSEAAQPRKEGHICLVTDQRYYDLNTLLSDAREIDMVYLNKQDTTHTGSTTTAGTANITLDASAATANDEYNDKRIRITSATTGDNQTRRITDYDGSTQVATVNADWDTIPTGTIDFEIYPSKYTLIDEIREGNISQDKRPTYE